MERAIGDDAKGAWLKPHGERPGDVPPLGETGLARNESSTVATAPASEDRLAELRRTLSADGPGERPKPIKTASPPGDSLPKEMVAVVKLLGVVLLSVGIYYGPAHYECQQKRASGLFWSGDTVDQCVKDWIADRNENVETFLRRVNVRP